MNLTVRTFDKRLFLAYVIFGLIALFYLPTLVPLPPNESYSYTFGYNNRAGVALLLLLVMIGAVWTNGLNLQFSTSGNSRPVSLKILFQAMIVILCGCLAMYLLAGRFGGFGESSYEIDRISLLSQSKIPYIDFEWPFGVGLLYGPLLLSHLFSMGLIHAYHLFWALSFLLGTLALFAVVNLVDYPTNSKKAIFLLLYGAGLPSIINMGTHYTFLRYTFPLLFILLLQKLLNRNSTKWLVVATILAIAFTIILLLISPEVAIAYAFASACIVVLTPRSRNRLGLALIAGLLLAFAGVFWIAMKLHVLDTVRASGGGADSFPIAFAPHILLFVFALFICACYVFRRFSERGINDNTIGLLAFSIPMLAAALGRCDTLHVVWNGEGLFLASMVYASNFRIMWKWYRYAFFSFAILLPFINAAWSFSGPLASIGSELLRNRGDNSKIRSVLIRISEESIVRFVKPNRRSIWDAKLERAERPAVPDRISFSQLYPSWHGTLLVPFGYKPHGDGFGTYLSNEINLGYYEGFENANTVAAIQEKLSEIKGHPEQALLLPDRFESRCLTDVSGRRRQIGILFDFPYFGRTVHTENVRKPVCDYILAHYRLTQNPDLENFDYGLWVAKPPTLPSECGRHIH
jgi:hypothetical protein